MGRCLAQAVSSPDPALETRDRKVGSSGRLAPDDAEELVYICTHGSGSAEAALSALSPWVARLEAIYRCAPTSMTAKPASDGGMLPSAAS